MNLSRTVWLSREDKSLMGESREGMRLEKVDTVTIRTFKKCSQSQQDTIRTQLVANVDQERFICLF